MPIVAAAAAPHRGDARLIAQIGANHHGIAGIAPHHAFPIADPTRLRVAAVVPELVDVIAAAPHCCAHMIVQNHHDARAGERVNHSVEDGERVFTLQAGVGGERVIADHGVALVHLVRPGQPDDIEAAAFDLTHDGRQGLGLEAHDDVVLAFGAIPIRAVETHAVSITVDDVWALRMQRHGRRRGHSSCAAECENCEAQGGRGEPSMAPRVCFEAGNETQLEHCFLSFGSEHIRLRLAKSPVRVTWAVVSRVFRTFDLPLNSGRLLG